jgi:CzcA family heavy metal efflux pump
MLQAVVKWSLHNRAVVVALSVLLFLAGIYAAYQSELDAFPEFAPPQVIVQTEAPGLSAQEVEQLVTLPIEQAVTGVPGLEFLRSRSIQGLSLLTVVFRDGTDLYLARQLVAERLTEAVEQLPDGVQRPRLGPMTKTTGRLVVFGFTSDRLSAMALRDRVQWVVRPRLLAIRGVAQVTLFGGEVRQFQVQVDPDKLAAHRLTVTDVLEATRQGTSIRGAGFQENDNQRLVVRTEGQVFSPEQLGETVVARSQGTPICLRDVAKVVEGPEPKFGDALINGQPGVAILAYKQFGSDTLRVTENLESELERMRTLLEREGIAIHTELFRQADFIQNAVGNVAHSLLIGALLVAVVLSILLQNVRTAFISLTAIPLSLLSAIYVLWLFDVSLNTLTLGGLAIAVGEVVDDAIIDVENIFRRLRENARAGSPRTAIEVALTASLEVRSAVVFATFIVVLVFIPVFFLSGVQGRLFAPLGYAYALAVMASLATALTLTPALASLMLQHAEGAEEPPLLRALQGGYEWLLRRLDRQLTFLLVIMTILLSGSAWALYRAGGEFLPELRESHLIVHMQALAGTSLPQTLVTGREVTARLREFPAVRGVCHLAGRAELGEDTWGVEYGEIEVPLTAAADVAEMQATLSESLPKEFPGYGFNVFTFLSECIHDSLSGSIAPVLIKVHGQELADIDRAAHAIAHALESVPGSENVRAEPQSGQPELVIRVRPQDAARLGVRPAEILEAVHTAYQGAEVGQSYDRNRIIKLVVVLDPAIRNAPERIGNLWISVTSGNEPGNMKKPASGTPDGESYTDEGRIQLHQVADVFLSDGRFLVTHENGLRMQAVTSGVRGRDVQSFVADVERRLSSLPMPEGVSFTITGEHQAKQASERELLLLGTAAGVGIVLLLWMAFRSVRLLLLVLLNVPFALVGGVAAVYWMGNVLNVGSLVGFVTLFGITMRNGIMMVSHWQHLHETDKVLWGPELVFRGARERLAPVLMTALVTGLGLMPIALGSGQAGREIEGPMALVILGGLVTSTALNLFVLPVLYRRFGSETKSLSSDKL